jgi:hypothetical protein
MKNILYPAFLMLIIVFFACKKEKETFVVVFEGNEGSATLEQCAIFKDYDDLQICLISINDGRCPCNADCIWEGAAEVTLQITKTGLDSTVSLFDKKLQGTTMDSSIVIGNETIILKSVKVEDFCSNQGQVEKYTIEVEVKN